MRRCGVAALRRCGVAATFAPRRIPFPALALAVCLLFAAVGVVAVDDYGISTDEPAQRYIAEQNAAYIIGDRDAFTVWLRPPRDRFYGVAFELPLLMMERALRLQDSRGIYLSRHLLTHLFFIAGGFCCGLLAWRMFNNRWLALLAMLLFLLHPRLYAHSFFNSKDIPFLVMFVIALYLTHRAFRRDTLGAFVLLGIVVGAAVNMRPFALLLLPAVLAMRGLDWWQSPGGGRRHILLTAVSVAAATLLAIYVSHPYYWENPLRFIQGIQVLSQHTNMDYTMFQGQLVQADAVPPAYIPVWFGITAPPVALLLGGAGIATALSRGWRTPGRIFHNGELRFLFLLLACLALPVAAAILLQSPLYNDWRHMYFLWGPFCLLAAGLHLPSRKTARNLLRRIAVYGLAAAGLGGAVYAIVSLHPHQQIYFSWLADRAHPGELGQQYQMAYWVAPYRQGMEYLLESYPDTMLYVYVKTWPQSARNRLMLPAAKRKRIAVSNDVWAADFHIGAENNANARAIAPGPTVHQWRAYGSAYLMVTAPAWYGAPGRAPERTTTAPPTAG